MKRTVIFRILFILYIATLSYLCFAKSSMLPEMDLNSKIFGIAKDKIAHFLMFLPYPAIAFLSIGKPTQKPWQSAVRIILIFLAGCIIAAGTEIIQSFIPERVPDVKDFLSDGIAMAICSIGVLIADISKKH